MFVLMQAREFPGPKSSLTLVTPLVAAPDEIVDVKKKGLPPPAIKLVKSRK
ncbi:hypothetical protein ACHMW6_06165 [Pseudoduganella sp. UC29_106]|uniref:hypothetical protein n=1 Tax=Pseudoduganella sp. UC29_106 TaxID=3374553 RepID=UPI003756C45F